MVPRVIDELDPDVILLQEINTTNEVWRKITVKYDAQVSENKKKESEILFSEKKFECMKIVPSSSKPLDYINLDEMLNTTIGDVVPRTEATDWNTEFRNRISIVGLKVKGDGPIVVFMSFHNKYNNEDEDSRKTASNNFCRIVSRISRDTGYTVIAGADLNCNLLEAPKDCDRVTVHGYTATRRRQEAMKKIKRGRKTEIIDRFIIHVAQPDNNRFEVTCTALDFVDTRVGDRLHPVMTSIKRDPYYNLIESHCDPNSKKEVKMKLDRKLEEGLNETLHSRIDDALDAFLGKELSSIDQTLHRHMKDKLRLNLAASMEKTLNIKFDEEVDEAFTHDPILLSIKTLKPSPRTESESESKSESKTESKSESKSESKTESESETNSED